MRFLLLLLIFAALCNAEDADATIHKARDILAQALPSATPSDQTRLQAAIEALDSLPATAAATTIPPSAPLDAKLLHKIIHAPFSLHGDTLTVAYDFQSGGQIKDWTVTGEGPDVKNGVFEVPVGSTLTCKLQFTDDEQYSGDIAMLNRNGTHIATSEGVKVKVDNYNAWNVHLSAGSEDFGQSKFSADYTNTDGSGDWIPWKITRKNNVLSLAWGQQKLGGQHGADIGCLTLEGGSGGNQFRKIVLTGTIDRTWVASALDALDRK